MVGRACESFLVVFYVNQLHMLRCNLGHPMQAIGLGDDQQSSESTPAEPPEEDDA